MFEKEADEMAVNNAKKIYGLEGSVCMNIQECAYVNGFQDGAEFGYNKANEWHYMKDEFPPEDVPLNIITFNKDKKRRLWEGEYNGGNGQWWTGYFNHFIDVPYAWKEIVLPELLKESEE